MAKRVKLRAADGHELDAFRSDPKGAPRGGLVVLQEIFGLTHHLDRLCDSFAEAGYAVCAPALFDRVERNVALGYVGDDYQKARDLRAKLNDAWILADCKAAVDSLAPIGKVGVIGYCFGGLVAWHCATGIDGLACAISLYGGGIAKIADRKPRCPVQFHFGDHDRSISLADVHTIRTAHPDLPSYVYDDAPHGFCTDDREGAFRPGPCQRATGRSLDFLRQHVG
jgi:carboxymethylenebutenolidase